jgi:UPF0176 protein
MDKPYTVLLYYCYTDIADPEDFRVQHHLYCIKNNLLGRIYVAHEGLNGTVSGLHADCEKYINDLKADPRFAHAHFKAEQHATHSFQKLHVRTKKEIVHSGLPHINPNAKTGKYLEPKDLWKKKDAILLDVRSNYEHKLGKFKNSITLDIENFREFPEKVQEIKEQFKNKEIITICTGGIKCEKASAYLLEQGFENVYQLHGGIIQYGLDTDGRDFEGKCYVFDNRIAVDINKHNPTTVSNCYVCKESTSRMVNCANPECNMHVPICAECGIEKDGACSIECKNHPQKRPYNEKGYYPRNTNHYNVYKGLNRKKLE